MLARNGCYFNFKPFPNNYLLFVVIMHIGNAGKTGTIIVNFQEQPAIRSIRRTKIEKRRLMTYSVFLFVCWF